MLVTKLKIGAVVLLASFTIASLTTLSAAPPQDPAASGRGAGAVPSKQSRFTPDRTLMYVNVYSTDPNAKRNDLVHCAHYLSWDFLRVEGAGIARSLDDRISVFRFRLNPDQMRAQNLSSDDMAKAFGPGCRMVQPRGDWLEEIMWKMFMSKKDELISIADSNKLERYEDLILRATPEGEVLRLKEVGRMELVSTFFDISSDVDGHPAATTVLKWAPGTDAAEVIEAVKERLKLIKDNTDFVETVKSESWPAMEIEVIPFENQSMIYVVIETRPGSTVEDTRAKCHELGAIANRIDGIASVTSLAGYQIRTESGGSNAGTCLIQLKDRSERKLTSRQIIETLEEKCRTIDAHVEFFEPPAVSAFFADGGFSVRVLDKINSNTDELSGSAPKTFMDGVLNRQDLSRLFNFLVSDYWQYELIIDNDVAMQKGVSIANALEKLAEVVGDDVQAERKFRTLTAELSHSSVKSDHGEMVPYSVLMQLKDKLRLNGTDPLKPASPRRDSR